MVYEGLSVQLILLNKLISHNKYGNMFELDSQPYGYPSNIHTWRNITIYAFPIVSK